jgi:folate-binding protein YgfZ
MWAATSWIMELNATSAISAPAISRTPLADHLAAAGRVSSAELVPYLGALTVQRFDVADVEIAALLGGAAVHDLGWLRRIAVRGEDRFRWLSGMVTNGVESLGESAGAYNLVLNAQGRIQGDCYVWRGNDGDDDLEIEVTAEQAEALMAHFDKFIIMDDVELFPVEDKSAIGIAGPEAARILAVLGASTVPDELNGAAVELTAGDKQISARIVRGYGPLMPHYAIWADVEAIPAIWEAAVGVGAVAVGSEALETTRVVEGIPAYGVDIQSRDLLQETSQDRAVSFTKGCYLGQEIVERVRSRGQVHRHIRGLQLFPEGGSALPAMGTELKIAEEKSAGILTSVAEIKVKGASRVFALGMIRAEAEIGGRALPYAGGSAKVLTAAPTFD